MARKASGADQVASARELLRTAKTADELIEHSKKILKKDANGDIQVAGYIPSVGDYIRWAFLYGGQFYDEANKKITIPSPSSNKFFRINGPTAVTITRIQLVGNNIEISYQ